MFKEAGYNDAPHVTASVKHHHHYDHHYDDTAAWLAQLGERRSTEREVAGSNPGRTNTQGLQITEEKVLPL